MAGRSGRDDREARRREQAYAVGLAVHEERARRRRRDNLLGGVIFGVVAALAIVAQIAFVTVGPGAPKPTASATPGSTPTPTPTPTATVPPKALSEDRSWQGTMTVGGAKLTFSLDGKQAPQAVASFLSLTAEGYFDGTYCPRMTTKTVYILQCGAKTDSTSAVGPYAFGPIENAPTLVKDGTRYGHRVYPTGVLAMARESGDAASQGSQFFIVYGADSTFPDDSAGGYTVFGRITAGLPALKTKVVDDGLASADASAGDGSPATTVTISSVTIAR